MKKTILSFAVILFIVICSSQAAHGELIRGAATLSSVSSVIKISREGNGLDSLVPGEILYIFTESGEPVSKIFVKDVFSDVIHSEPLPESVARQIRATNSILIFSNLREYGDFIIAFRDGSEDALGSFIKKYPDSELREETQRILDGLVYRPFKIRGTIEAFEEFLSKNPENYYADNALKRRDDLQYMLVQASDRISRYRWFISTYPDNIHAGKARERIETLLPTYEQAKPAEIANYPRSHLWRKVRFSGALHSALPIYVEGPGVGRKTARFRSPRNASEHLNFQVQADDVVLWRLFVDREKEDVVKTIQESRKGDSLLIYGMVFTNLGGAPWIDVDDIEKY